MNDPVCARAEANLEALLRQAHDALDDGDVQLGRELSHQVLKSAQKVESKRFEAKALLCLAHCDRMLSRYRRAHRASQRAAQIFQLLKDTSGEVMALTTHAYVAVNLGRNEEAVEAALLSVRLSEFLDNDEHSVLAYNALGVAYFWSRRFDKAEQSLRTAIQIAQQASPPLHTFQPTINQWWTQLIRLFHERYEDGEMPSLALLRSLRDSAALQRQQIEAADRVQSNHVTTSAVLLFGASLDACWHANPSQALILVQDLSREAKRYGTLTWLSALEAWARAEIAWAIGDWAGAIRNAQLMVEVSVTVEHEQLACLGHMLASQLHAAQGHATLALGALRELRQREQLIRSDCLESREHVIDWQIDLRLHQRSIDQLELTSRQLERLSLEDSLTGIPNRRHFERYTSALLSESSERCHLPCLALMDLDGFKQINDNFSHQVGDEVLQRVALILKSHVRENDLAARLGGDEFVIVFKTCDLHSAGQVCQRIADAVRTFNWAELHPQLRCSLSIGVVRAEAGDTVASLTHRGDSQMYERKRLRHRPSQDVPSAHRP